MRATCTSHLTLQIVEDAVMRLPLFTNRIYQYGGGLHCELLIYLSNLFLRVCSSYQVTDREVRENCVNVGDGRVAIWHSTVEVME
jgi:hypothetical protein